MENGRMREMKHVMKTIAIGIEDVVRQWIAEENPVPTQIAARSFATLINRNLKVLRQPLVFGEPFVEDWQARIIGSDETAFGLCDVHPDDLGKSDSRGLEP